MRESFMDDRVARLRRRIRPMVERNRWKPDLATILKLEAEYKVTGGYVNKIFMEERELYLNRFDDDPEENEDWDD